MLCPRRLPFSASRSVCAVTCCTCEEFSTKPGQISKQVLFKVRVERSTGAFAPAARAACLVQGLASVGRFMDEEAAGSFSRWFWCFSRRVCENMRSDVVRRYSDRCVSDILPTDADVDYSKFIEWLFQPPPSCSAA